MISNIVILLSVLPLLQGQMDSIPSGHFSFEKKGQITNVIEMAHIVIPIDFQHLAEQIASFCDATLNYRTMMKEKEGSYLFSHTTSRLSYSTYDRCNDMRDDLSSIRSVWTSASSITLTQRTKVETHARPRRQLAVLTIGVLSILSCFSQLYSQKQMFTLLQETNDNTNNAIKKLDGLESKVQLNANNIVHLNKTIEAFSNNINHTFNTMSDVMIGMSFHVLLNSLDAQLNKLITGISLLSKHRLSPLLVRPVFLIRHLRELRNTLLQKNVIMGVENIYDLFDMDVSHAMLANNTLLVYVHIPCFHPDQLMTLYHLHPVPVKLPTIPVSYVLPHSTHDYLALSTSELEFQSYSMNDLNECRILNDIRYCHRNIVRRDIDNDCLMSLFKQDTMLIRNNCPWKLATVPQVTQYNSSHFAVFVPPPGSIDFRLRCPHSRFENRSTMTGLSIIQLDPGCHALCDQFVFTAPNDVPIYSEVISTGLITLKPFFDPLTNLTTDFNAFAATLRASQRPLSLSTFRDYPTLRSPPLPPPWYKRVSIWAALLTSFLSIFSIVLYCYYRSCAHRLSCRWLTSSPSPTPPHTYRLHRRSSNVSNTLQDYSETSPPASPAAPSRAHVATPSHRRRPTLTNAEIDSALNSLLSEPVYSNPPPTVRAAVAQPISPLPSAPLSSSLLPVPKPRSDVAGP